MQDKDVIATELVDGIYTPINSKDKEKNTKEKPIGIKEKPIKINNKHVYKTTINVKTPKQKSKVYEFLDGVDISMKIINRFAKMIK